ncbi:hypothetical protein LSTR_LSTR012524 [Laodelphax striatellus]|uniref:H15 domain-containing protein n=1 Tax=Laodelphax striatellus TaxID=195883 RepID=A0A482XM53_LAOST|nr:hypothetical protein LSTR_LSTR012524 [Laodelphax striatellus]
MDGKKTPQRKRAASESKTEPFYRILTQKKALPLVCGSILKLQNNQGVTPKQIMTFLTKNSILREEQNRVVTRTLKQALKDNILVNYNDHYKLNFENQSLVKNIARSYRKYKGGADKANLSILKKVLRDPLPLPESQESD